jgi:hypothetical protein
MISLDAREGEMFHCLPAASAGIARGPNPKHQMDSNIVWLPLGRLRPHVLKHLL